MLSISLCLLRWSSTLGRSYLPFQDLVWRILSIAALVFLFFFCHPLLLPMLFLTVCLRPLFAHVLPISFCFQLLSSLGAFSCQSLLSIPSSSFYLLVLLCILFGPSSFLLSVSSPPVSLSVTVFPNRIYTFPFSCFFSFLSHIMPFYSPPCCCSCLHSPLYFLTTSSILTHCTAQV